MATSRAKREVVGHCCGCRELRDKKLYQVRFGVWRCTDCIRNKEFSDASASADRMETRVINLPLARTEANKLLQLLANANDSDRTDSHLRMHGTWIAERILRLLEERQ